jgi:hypothetical protein
MAIQVTILGKMGTRIARLHFISLTIAITVVTGVTKRNHRVNISARSSGNQLGIRRSMGNASRNAANPNKAGEHHRSGDQILLTPSGFSSEFVTAASATIDILAR